jgi:hypothetical protein
LNVQIARLCTPVIKATLMRESDEYSKLVSYLDNAVNAGTVTMSVTAIMPPTEVLETVPQTEEERQLQRDILYHDFITNYELHRVEDTSTAAAAVNFIT